MKPITLALAVVALGCSRDATAPRSLPSHKPAFTVAAPTGVTTAITDCNSAWAWVLVSYTVTDPTVDLYRASFNTPGTLDRAGTRNGQYASSPSFPATSSFYAAVLYGTWDVYVDAGRYIAATGHYEFSAPSERLTVSVAHKACPKR